MIPTDHIEPGDEWREATGCFTVTHPDFVLLGAQIRIAVGARWLVLKKFVTRIHAPGR